MSAPGTKLPVYNIAAGLPFADTLAAGLLAETADDPLQLAEMRIFLPTRRACRVLRESFLRLSAGRPLLLPRMQPIGDVQEDEATLMDALAGAEGAETIATELPPATPPLRRQLLLARAIMAAPDLGAALPEQAMALASALGRLLDQVHTENLSIESLQHIVPGDEIHWQVTVKFLRVLSEVWPGLLAQEGMIDAADRRNRLMIALAQSWRAHPPQGRVIAAGTTGSIPATAELLAVIANLPRGAVVLPGLDKIMDDESWAALDDNHPQATLRQLLARLEIERADVRDWYKPQDLTPRRWLAAEMMRPAATSDHWQGLQLPQEQREALIDDLSNNIDIYECDSAQDEARLVAAILRHTIETPRQTVAVITPDRRLARRVAAICRRWDVAVDDSAGQSLAASPVGALLRLCARAGWERLRPASLLALLHHPLCSINDASSAEIVSALEIQVLRGVRPPPGFEGLRNHMAVIRADKKRSIDPAIDGLLNALEDAIGPFKALLCGQERHDLSVFAAAHIAAAENIARTAAQEGAELLWAGDDGAAAAQLMADLLEHGALMPSLSGEEYIQMLDGLMAGVSVRSPTGLHPRIFILGQLEARLVQADITIMAGLNEGTWPAAPGPDPWLSRTMRNQAGLPPPERSIGLAAHDFVQGFCAPRTIITRARRLDGAQGVPARWLQRLETVLRALGIDPQILLQPAPGTPPYEILVRQVDMNPHIRPAERPAPTPPVALRPRSLSVTEIETWLRDPYAIYAKHVLRLTALQDLEKDADAAARGTLLHDALNDFVAENPDHLPPDSARQIYERGFNMIHSQSDNPGFWEFWLPRFESLCHWFVDHEREWRKERNRPLAWECKGQMTLPGPSGSFVLRVRADRIDRMADGRMAVIDYKSGGAQKYSNKRILSGHLPQLPLTAMILGAGGIENVPPGDPGYLGYWILTGKETPGEEKSLRDNIDEALQVARTGIEDLIAAFDQPEQAYHALPRPDHLPDYNDYDHLARVQEWTALADGGEEGFDG